MTAAIFRAEFLRALPAWPWLLASHAIAAIAGILPSGQTGVQTVLLGSIASWSVGALSLFLVVRSLWEENPNRSEHFLATRPMRFAALLKGKVAGLLILILVPFILAEAAVLIGRNQPAQVIGIGLLEASVMLLIFIGVAFAAVWCWSKRSQAYVGLPLAIGMAIATAALLDRVPSLKFSDSNYLKEKLLSLPAMLCGLLTFGVVAASCAVIFGRGRKFRRVLSFAALGSLVPAVMMPLVRVKREAGPRSDPSLVHVTLSNQDMGDRVATKVGIQPPAPDPKRENDLIWSVDSLKVNGQRVEPGPMQGIADRLRVSNSEELWSRPIRSALRAHFGAKIQLPPVLEERNASYSAEAIIPGNYDPARMLDLEVGLLGTFIDWEVVADLPLSEDAEARWGNTRWLIRGFRQGNDWFNTQFFISAQLVETAPYLWLSDLEDGQLSDRRYYRYFLIRETDGKVIKQSLSPSYGSAGWRRVSLCLRERENQIAESSSRSQLDSVEPFLSRDTSYRLAIVRGTPAGSISAVWKTPSPLSCAGLWTPATGVHSPPPPDPRAGTAPEWLRDHPAPASGATDEAVQAWLDEFIPRIGDHHSNDVTRRLKATVGSLLAEHPAMVIKSMRELSPFASGPRGVLGWAVMDHLPREYIARMTTRDFDEELYRLAVSKGWRGDLTSIAAQRARMGFGWQVEKALTSSPKEVGFSKEEWCDFFRLYPTADAFRALAGVVLPREELEMEVDRLLEDFEAPLPNPHIDPLLELALARGRNEAPRWLRDGIRRRQASLQAFASVWVKDPIRKWFAFPSHLKTDDEVVGWFLNQEPDRFVFDSVSGKFQLR